MKIIIEGSPKELAKLAAVLNGAATAEKKAEIPPLLTELAETNAIVRNAKVRPIDKINELAKAIQNTGKENAPQVETAERQENQVLSREEARAIVKSMDTAAKEALKFQYHTP